MACLRPFSREPRLRYPPMADRVRLLTRIHRLWFTVPERFYGPENLRAFRLRKAASGLVPRGPRATVGEDEPS